MTPDERARLAVLADEVKHLSWDACVEYGCGAQGCDEGGDVEARLYYDDLPDDIRALVEAVPALLAEVERRRMEAVAFAEAGWEEAQNDYAPSSSDGFADTHTHRMLTAAGLLAASE